MYFK
jgi:hypothetical protein